MEFDKRIGEVLKELAAKNELEAVEQYITNLKTHHSNPVYIEAREQIVATQIKAINKGAGKYPETLNPDSWSVEELEQHAFDEIADLTHYNKALGIKARKLEQRVSHLTAMAKTHGQIIADLGNEMRELEKDRNRWKNDCKEYAQRLDNANDQLVNASQEISHLKKVVEVKEELLEEQTKQYIELEDRVAQQSRDIARLDEQVGQFKNELRDTKESRRFWEGRAKDLQEAFDCVNAKAIELERQLADKPGAIVNINVDGGVRPEDVERELKSIMKRHQINNVNFSKV